MIFRQTYGSKIEQPANVETIKLFWSRRIGDYNGNMTPVPLSSHTFRRIALFARIPEIYARVLDYKAATYVFAIPQLPSFLRHRSPKAMRKQYLSFILQSVPGAMSHVCVSASFTYDFSTKHMYIFMHGLASNNYDRFSYAIQGGASSMSTFLVPSIIVRFNLEQRVKALNLWQDKIYWNERRIGIRFDHYDNPELSSIDFSTLSKDLNAVNTNLAFIVLLCKSTTRMLEFLDQVARRYKRQADNNGVPEDESTEIEQLLLDTNSELRSWNVGLEDRAEYVSKRGQAIVQTVYSAIAQRDSATSLRLASTSTSLAQSSQSVAISTSRDSAVMRIIAAITIFFLPATFTATFFSTTFFSFNDDLGGRIYSQWIWLYFLVTIVLTLIVVVGTWFLWRMKEREVMAALITPKEEQGTDPVAFDQRPTELELDQFVEQESGNVARRETIARLRTGLDWTKSTTQQKTAHGQGEPSA
ncbi:hypothetical protein AA0119_g12375 [Alternaria tenuissima]|uniref:Uncharacterized protein n=1 Tax=Alternaria tenuissima TaxID=119927 RepID=A0AB37WT26_9PLEO|nr:hypothetical protein AA0115_g2476 [Alternaria tenuissima]RYN87408.1 hypothetical protein AA0119_g12375 [Alternaria tenuissima]